MAHDASPTWSGFNYQGKIALFHALKEMNNLLGANVNYCFDGYELLVENNEDFDIKVPAGFTSFHQVKALNKTSFGAYSNAILEMILELSKQGNIAVSGYLHVWNSILFRAEEDFQTSIRTTLQNVIVNYNDAVDKNDSFIGKAINDGTVNEIGKLSAIIRKRFGQNLSIPNVFAQINALLNGANSPLTRLHLYEYPDGNKHCPLENISGLVENEISLFLNHKGEPDSVEKQNKIFHALLGKIDRHVILRHLHINDNAVRAIPFNELIDIILDPSIEDSTDDYLANHFKLKFLEKFEGFINDPDLVTQQDYDSYSDGDVCNLTFISQNLCNVQASSLWLFYKFFSPHLELSTEININNALNVNFESLLFSLFPILNELNRSKSCKGTVYNEFLYSTQNHRYLPTTIGQTSPSLLAKKLINSPSMIENVFEISSLIGGHGSPSISNLVQTAERCRDVDISTLYENYSPTEKEKVMEMINEIRLIRLDIAKAEIN